MSTLKSRIKPRRVLEMRTINPRCVELVLGCGHTIRRTYREERKAHRELKWCMSHCHVCARKKKRFEVEQFTFQFHENLSGKVA